MAIPQMQQQASPQDVMGALNSGQQGDIYTDALKRLSPEQIDKMYRDYVGEQSSLQRQGDVASALRTQQAPQGMTVGNQYFASSPTANIANVLGKGVGAYFGHKTNEQMKQLGADRASASKDYAKALRGF